VAVKAAVAVRAAVLAPVTEEHRARAVRQVEARPAEVAVLPVVAVAAAALPVAVAAAVAHPVAAAVVEVAPVAPVVLPTRPAARRSALLDPSSAAETAPVQRASTA